MKLTREQINDHLSQLAGWQQEGEWLIRDSQHDNFGQALAFVNRVAAIAESLDHHPDILLHGWNKVRLSVTTHDVGGLTEKDFALAKRINQLN